MIKKKIVKLSLPLFKRLIPYRLPRVIAMEATNRCFLECLTCPVPQQMRREKGDMSLLTFKTLLAQINWKVDKMSWAFGGEPLLNKDLWKMVALAKEKGIISKVDTNGMLINEYIDEILNSGLEILNIAFEGLSKESTSNFRKGYNYELVMKNIEFVCRQRRQKKSKTPYIALNYLVRRDNENEIQKTMELARGWGVDSITLKSINISPSCWLTQEFVQDLGEKFLPVERNEFSRYIYKNNKWMPKNELSDYCRYLFNSVTITWDGKVLPCCMDFDATLAAGDIFKEGLRNIWQGKTFSQIRNRVFSNSVAMCKDCTSVSLQKKINLNP